MGRKDWRLGEQMRRAVGIVLIVVGAAIAWRGGRALWAFFTNDNHDSAALAVIGWVGFWFWLPGAALCAGGWLLARPCRVVARTGL